MTVSPIIFPVRWLKIEPCAKCKRTVAHVITGAINNNYTALRTTVHDTTLLRIHKVNIHNIHLVEYPWYNVSGIHIYILVVIVIVSFQTMMKRYGWKRKRKGPAKHRKTYSVPKGRYSYRMMGYALAFRRKFSKVDIIRWYQRVFGRESPSPTVICRWYSRASTPPSLPDTVILSGSESDDEWVKIRGDDY